MDDIFISYAHKDKDRVAPVVELLRENNFNVFWDEDIRTGEDWRSKLEKKLKEVYCVVVVWSNISRDREFIQDEAQRATNYKKHFPVIIDKDFKELPLGFGKPNYIRLAINRAGAIVDGMEKFREDITEFIEERRNHVDERDRGDEMLLSGDSEQLIKSVNRSEQIKLIRPVLQKRDRALFVFSCQVEDWPEALAHHLASDVGKEANRSRHDEHITLSLSKYSGRYAFKDALRDKITRQSQTPELLIRDWISNGPSLKVIYACITSEGGMFATRSLLRSTASYIADLEALPNDRSIVVLLAMIPKGRLGCFSHCIARSRLSHLTNLYYKCLPPLGTISSIHIEDWINDFSELYNQQYDRDRLKERLLELLPSGKEDRYMKLIPKLRQALLAARRG